jgi:cob(I)alamin adenosyltransferase
MSFKINRVYTRSGDKGETSLVDGSRVPKDDTRCAIYGTFDEISSFLGLAKCEIEEGSDTLLFQLIEYIQQELFDLGSEVATPSGFTYPSMWKVQKKHTDHLEKLCDFFNKDLPELDSFILPGGSKLCSYLHCARTITRRAERLIVTHIRIHNDSLSSEVLIYVNRLSDLLFVLSRYVLHSKGITPPLWKQEKDRVSPLT